IDCFVNAVFVYDDKIVLTFNYKDGAKTIALDDVNGSDLVDSGPPKIEACVITQVSIFISSKIYYGGLYQPDGILQKAPPAAARQMKLSQGRDFSSEESRPFLFSLKEWRT
ncbi:MAG: hypothetical protein HFF28_09050, partial [Oscillospiraceae bacterium]|nr:hypothetical protein [Oscillospiraceae bacterium]